MPSLEQAKFLEAVKVLRRNPHTKDKTLDTAVKVFCLRTADFAAERGDVSTNGFEFTSSRICTNPETL